MIDSLCQRHNELIFKVLCHYLRVSETARFLCAAHEHEKALEHRIATALSCSEKEHCVELKLRYKKL